MKIIITNICIFQLFLDILITPIIRVYGCWNNKKKEREVVNELSCKTKAYYIIGGKCEWLKCVVDVLY